MFWSRKQDIGLDLGAYSIKCCSLTSSGSACTVAQELLLPQRESREQSLSDDSWLVRLQSLLARLPQGKKGKNPICLSLDDMSLACGYLELPHLAGAQLEVAIPTAVAREIPRPLNEVQLFTTPVPALKQSGQRGIFFTAVPKALLESRRQLLVRAGLEIHREEPAVLAQLRSIRNNLDLAGDQPWVLVHSGFENTTVTVWKGPHPYFYRMFRLAGSDFTYAFQMGDQVSWAEAEQRKCDYHLDEQDFHVESFVQRWIQEIRRSLSFAERKFPELEPTKVLLSGGTSLWNGLPERLSKELNLPTSRHAWQRLKVSEGTEKTDLPFYDIALGLVCRS